MQSPAFLAMVMERWPVNGNDYVRILGRHITGDTPCKMFASLERLYLEYFPDETAQTANDEIAHRFSVETDAINEEFDAKIAWLKQQCERSIAECKANRKEQITALQQTRRVQREAVMNEQKNRECSS